VRIPRHLRPSLAFGDSITDVGHSESIRGTLGQLPIRRLTTALGNKAPTVLERGQRERVLNDSIGQGLQRTDALHVSRKCAVLSQCESVISLRASTTSVQRKSRTPAVSRQRFDITALQIEAGYLQLIKIGPTLVASSIGGTFFLSSAQTCRYGRQFR